MFACVLELVEVILKRLDEVNERNSIFALLVEEKVEVELIVVVCRVIRVIRVIMFIFNLDLICKI